MLKAKMVNHILTKEIKEKWAKMDKEGVNRIEIAKQTGFNKSTVRKHLVELNGRKLINLANDNDNIVKDFNKGMIVEEIAKKYKSSRSGIYHILYKTGTMEDINENRIENFKKNLDKLTQYQIGYIAGIIDGEGSICIKKSSKEKGIWVGLSISNCNEKIIFISELIPEFSIYKEDNKKKNIKWKDGYKLVMQRREFIKIFLEKFSKYLILKKEVADYMINLIKEQDDNKKEELYLKIKKFNKKGREI